VPLSAIALAIEQKYIPKHQHVLYGVVRLLDGQEAAVGMGIVVAEMTVWLFERGSMYI